MIQGARPHAHENFANARNRFGNVRIAQNFCSAMLQKNNRLHPLLPLILCLEMSGSNLASQLPRVYQGHFDAQNRAISAGVALATIDSRESGT